MEYDAPVKEELAKIPAVWRITAEKALEEFACSKGRDRVTVAIFEEAKAKYFGSKV